MNDATKLVIAGFVQTLLDPVKNWPVFGWFYRRAMERFTALAYSYAASVGGKYEGGRYVCEDDCESPRCPTHYDVASQYPHEPEDDNAD